MTKFEPPINLELDIMDYIYQTHERDGCFSSQKNENLSINLAFSGDLELIKGSKYINVIHTDIGESFELTPYGKKYMEQFYYLVRRKYSDIEGAIKDNEMINSDKRNLARQIAKENMKDWNPDKSDSNDKEKKEKILKLEPEIYGVGINLKALWHKICKRKK